jgi:hypothetical protein
MITVKHFLNGTEVVPENYKTIGFRADWTSDPSEAELTADRIIFTNNARRLIFQHIESGAGLFEGIPYTVQFGTVEIEYFIDLTDNPQFTDSSIEVSIKKRKGIKWFLESADGLSFELLNKKVGGMSYQLAPYVIVKDNQLELGLMLSLSTYSLTRELIQSIKDLVTTISQTIQAATPSTGTGVVIDIGDIIALVLNIAAQIVYIAALVIALIDLIKQLIELIFPKVRYFKVNTVEYLLKTGIEYLGYQFSSTLISTEYKFLTVVPVPLVPANKSIFNFNINLNSQPYTKGYPTSSDTVSSLGALIDFVKMYFNASVRIIGNTVHIERRKYWQQYSSLNIRNTLNLQDKRKKAYTYNMGDNWKRKYIKYQNDIADTHTADNWEGADCEYSTEPINVVNPDLVLIKGFREIDIPFAMGARKKQLNFIEKAAEKLAITADKIINGLGGNSSFTAKIQARIGVMQISQQYFSVTKLIWAVGGKQPANYLDVIGANAIYTKNHVTNQVKENFQYIETADVPFSPDNFLNLLENNFASDQDGNEIEILSLEYMNDSAVATIEFSIPSGDANNLKTEKING